MTFRRSLLDVIDFVPPPPPETVALTQNDSSDDLNPSILIISLILTVVFLVSISLHLLLRFLNRRFHSSDADVAPLPDSNITHLINVHVSSDRKTLLDSLPIFSFNSVAGIQKSAPDCAVCLSRFVPHDQLRLLPNCCHAFHSECVDTWLATNHTCPLCRSTVHVAEFPTEKTSSVGGESFRLEIGSVSRGAPETAESRRRSYSVGSFEYVVEDDAEVFVEPVLGAGHRRGVSECAGGAKDKDDPPPPGAEVAEVAGGRGWLKEYVDRLASSASSSFSSRALSFRFSGRFGAGSSHLSDNGGAGGSWDLEGNRMGEEGSNFFRWLFGA